MSGGPPQPPPVLLSSAEDPRLRNPFWHALTSLHHRFAIGSTRPDSHLALRYPVDILPIAAVSEPSAQALGALAALLAPGEPIYLTDLSSDPPVPTPELAYLSLLPGLQMILPPQAVSAFPKPSLAPAVRKLEAADSPAMVALTQLAFPGFFRGNTVQLGSYYGLHRGGELIAMAGERAALPGYRELSAVCTHPDHRGQGHAVTLMGCLARDHAAAGLHSILHVGVANTTALRLYRQLGFEPVRAIFFHQLRRI